MAEEPESLSEDQIGALVRRLLGPEEEWDDAAAEFVLQVHDIDPDSSGSYVQDLIFREIVARRQRGENIPPILWQMFSSLNAKDENEGETADAAGYLKGRFGPEASTEESEQLRVLRAARRTQSKLSAEDKKILSELESELIRNVESPDSDK
jgi:hypothetical protein